MKTAGVVIWKSRDRVCRRKKQRWVESTHLLYFDKRSGLYDFEVSVESFI
jgi:hypothetical protein